MQIMSVSKGTFSLSLNKTSTWLFYITQEDLKSNYKFLLYKMLMYVLYIGFSPLKPKNYFLAKVSLQ